MIYGWQVSSCPRSNATRESDQLPFPKGPPKTTSKTVSLTNVLYPATINNAEVQHVRRVTPYVQNPSVRHEKARRYFQLDIHGPLAMQRVFCILDNYPWWNCSTHPPVQKKKNQAIVSALKRWRMRLLNALKPHQAQISIVNEYDLGKKKRMLLHRASFLCLHMATWLSGKNIFAKSFRWQEYTPLGRRWAISGHVNEEL